MYECISLSSQCVCESNYIRAILGLTVLATCFSVEALLLVVTHTVGEDDR